MDKTKYLAIDIGGTNLRLANYANEKLRNITKYKISTLSRNELIKIISDRIRSDNPDAIGISVAGPMDLHKGIIKPVNWKEKEIPLIDYLKDVTDKPINLINDAIAGVIAENLKGAAVGYKNVVYLTFSSGIGAGIVDNGKILLGKDGNAHEVGHFVVDVFSSKKCNCGSFGHWESYCGGTGILSFYYKLTGKKIEDPSKIFEEHFLQLPENEYFFELCFKINAAGIANIINAYDPEIIVLSGSMYLNNKKIFLKMINRYLKDYVTNRPPVFTTAKFGHNAPLMGAAILASERNKLYGSYLPFY
ncbi:MAG: ROK family protein [Nitrososphaeria archaeon]